jgi:hypothetical protein
MSRGGAALLLAGVLLGACAAPAPLPSELRVPSPVVPPSPGVAPAEVAGRVTSDGLAADLDALAAIARERGGTRGTGTPGDLATADHVERALIEAGYSPWSDAFRTPVYSDPGGSVVAIDGGATFRDPSTVLPLIFSPAGDVEGPVVDLGWDPDARDADGSGCEAADFAGLPAGAIVLVRPAACFRRVVLEHAQAAGAAALVTAAPWAGPGEIRRSTLITPDGLDIPALAVSRDVGSALAEAAAVGGRARVVATGETGEGDVRSVFAEVPGADPSRVVMLGAHLDSSLDGPGLNDDGTGVAGLLAIARAFAGTTPGATIRLAFWAAEETGLHGSSRYVEGLSPDELARIGAYLNADMTGSPNGFAGVYDEPTAAAGSAAIRDRLGAALEAAGVQWHPVDLGLGADHAAFAAAGIPTGGVFAGASEPVTPEQATGSGGQAGRPADSCYHLACDGRANVNEPLLLALTRALAEVTAELAGDAR